MAADSSVVIRLEPAEARDLCERLYWPPREVRSLTGWADASFYLRDAAGREFVLKVSEPSVDERHLALQTTALERLAASEIEALPRVVRSRSGRAVEVVEYGERRSLVRMLTFVPGHLLAELPERPTAVLRQLGGLLARVDRVLGEIDDPAARRPNEWDIARLSEMKEITGAIEGDERQRLADEAIEAWTRARAAAADNLRRSLIHNDGNEHNVVVDSLDPETAVLTGLIDFGDLVESDLVVELAVAMTYAGIESSDPWRTAMPVLEGYDEECRLNNPELRVLFPAVRARLALSVSMSARRRAVGSADEYALVSEASAWAALTRLERISPDEAMGVVERTIGRRVRGD